MDLGEVYSIYSIDILFRNYDGHGVYFAYKQINVNCFNINLKKLIHFANFAVGLLFKSNFYVFKLNIHFVVYNMLEDERS